MAESTLSLTVANLAREVGSYLGFGRTAANWTGWDATAPYVVPAAQQDSQLAWIMESVDSGLRQFYDPPLTEGMPVAHRWSFLRPEAQLSIIANKSEYDLPDAFGGLVGAMNYQPTDNSPYSVRQTGIGEVRATLQRLVSTVGKPVMVAIQPKQTDGAIGQRFKAVFAPNPDASYSLGYRFIIQPFALTAQYPYPFGGEKHGETIKESCLAVAESRFQDEQSVHRQQFMERLAASISADTRDNVPDSMGKNIDRTRVLSRWPGSSRHDWDNDLMTYNGVVPG